MTQYWDILENGDLAVWTHDLDPSTDDPAQTESSGGYNWDDESPPEEVYDMLETERQKGVPDQANGLTQAADQIQADMIHHIRGDTSRIQRR